MILGIQPIENMALQGEVKMSGDKSISHRALIFASQAIGTSNLHNLLKAEDIAITIAVLKQLGVDIYWQDDICYVVGVGIGGLNAPKDTLYMGNSGTTIRLMMGLLASYDYHLSCSGDASLSRRSMQYLLDNLANIGAACHYSNNYNLPIIMQGIKRSMPFVAHLQQDSAQVKSALLLAALNLPGVSVIHEYKLSRDHSEILLAQMAPEVIHIESATNELNANNADEWIIGNAPAEISEPGRIIHIKGYQHLQPLTDYYIAGDASAAAFLTVAALIIPGSEIVIKDIVAASHRFGIYAILKQMGGNIISSNERFRHGERIVDLCIKASSLVAVDMSKIKPSYIIDEYPILAVAACFARGQTVINGVASLRNKESDRISAICYNLRQFGVSVEEYEDGFAIDNNDKNQLKLSGELNGFGDHRIIMAMTILALAVGAQTKIAQADAINTSFPEFVTYLNKLFKQEIVYIYNN